MSLRCSAWHADHMKRAAPILLLSWALLSLVGCSSTTTPPEPGKTAAAASSATPASGTATTDSAAGRFPDIRDASATRTDEGTWTFEVTVSSPYDSPERYADGWRIMADDQVFGEKTLTHDHAGEQPFTRTQTGVQIPEDVSTVTVQGRDLENGYGGSTLEVSLGN